MSDLLDHPAAIRSGEELDLAKLEPYLRKHFPTKPAASSAPISQRPLQSHVFSPSRYERISPSPPALRQQSEIRARYVSRISRTIEASLRVLARSRGALLLRRR